MSDNKKSRVRPAVVELEGRVMADAKMVGAFVGAVNDLAVSRPVPVEFTRLSLASSSAIQAVKAAAVSSYQFTAVTIKNSSTATLTYNFRWGNGATTNYSLPPGLQRVHYIRSLNQVATITYDKSFATGFQEQHYTLAGKNIVRLAGFYLVEPTPTVAEGRLYTFKGVPNGVQLYS